MAFWRHYYHLVWATKGREPLIGPEIEARVYAYLVSKAAELGVYVYAINGWSDHVHLVVAIPPRLSVAEVVKHLKGASAHFVNHSLALEVKFGWQRGYGSLAMGTQQRSIAEAYVRNQKEHHAAQTTNGWLEYCTALDEGPPETGLMVDNDTGFVAEGPGDYDVWGPVPF